MQDNSFTLKGHKVEVVPSGAHGWFDFYIDGKPWGCAKAHDIRRRIQEVIDLKAK